MTSSLSERGRQFLRSAMGICSSCCPQENNGDENESYGPQGERSRLLNGEDFVAGDETENETFPNELGDAYLAPGGLGAMASRYSTSLPKALNDDNSILQDFVNKMAGDVIDINSAHATHIMDSSDYHERAHEYGRRLQKVAHELVSKYSSNDFKSQQKVLSDSGSTVSAEKALTADVLSDSDNLLIREIASRAQEAVQDFNLENTSNLVVVFGETNAANGSNNPIDSAKNSSAANSISADTSEEDDDHRA